MFILQRMKNTNKDLKEQMSAQNEKIENLENKIKDHEDRIEKRKLYSEI